MLCCSTAQEGAVGHSGEGQGRAAQELVRPHGDRHHPDDERVPALGGGILSNTSPTQ